MGLLTLFTSEQSSSGGGGSNADSRVLIDTYTASNDKPTFSGIDDTYYKLELVCDELVMTNDADDFQIRTTATGPTASDAAYIQKETLMNSSETQANRGDDANWEIQGLDNVGTASNEAVSGIIEVFNPSGTGHTGLRFLLVGINNTSDYCYNHGAGYRIIAEALTSILLRGEGNANIVSGTVKLYGFEAS